MKKPYQVNDALEPPGRKLCQVVAENLQRQFVTTFIPEHLPKLSPPYCGRLFEEADRVSSCFFKSTAFLNGKRVLCMPSRTPVNGKSKFRRDIYISNRKELSLFLLSLKPDTGFDLYIFDRSFAWFIAILEERLFQTDNEGQKLKIS